ncbi:uncharacterized protein LOC127239663 [Andrographis paniculata]|uniref:uncharacterized protein LOC127239663 n=1 Tax=Andrographis paniculata TaxID=175694 RepID=UPI0021E7D210|nr:uncharacterized protein LOC127239663 [Andrographis paniculata]
MGMMANHIDSIHNILMSSLSTLTSPLLRRFTLAASAVSRRRLRRLSAILSSPVLFSLTLRRLQSLSLHHKSLIVAKYLLSSIELLKQFAVNDVVGGHRIAPLCSAVKLRDLDAVLLLLLLCEIHQHDRRLLLDAPLARWRVVLSGYVSDSILRISNFAGTSSSDVLVQYVESIGRCWGLVSAIGGGCGVERKEVPASAAAVVALPSVAATGGGICAICTEEISERREVCELPCRHLFHWMCILRWLKKRDSCPYCRRRLPTDDVRREIERLLEDLARIDGGGSSHRDHCSVRTYMEDNAESKPLFGEKVKMEGEGEAESVNVRTVNCLRGRLLAERMASKHAKEEAHILGNKMMELEKLLEDEEKRRRRAERRLKRVMKKMESLNISITTTTTLISDEFDKSEVSVSSSSSSDSSLCTKDVGESIMTIVNGNFNSTNKNEKFEDEVEVEIEERSFFSSSSYWEKSISSCNNFSNMDYDQSTTVKSWREEPIEQDKDDDDDGVDNSMALVPVKAEQQQEQTRIDPQVLDKTVKEVLDALKYAKEQLQSSMERRSRGRNMIRVG